METNTSTQRVNFTTRPAHYHHWKLDIEGPVAWLRMKVSEDDGLRPGYKLKMNSYDLAVDIELDDAVTRLRFEHPEVSVVAIERSTPARKRPVAAAISPSRARRSGWDSSPRARKCLNTKT